MAASNERTKRYLEMQGFSVSDAKEIDLRATVSLAVGSRYRAESLIVDGEAIALCEVLSPRPDPDEVAFDRKQISEMLGLRPVFVFGGIEREIGDALVSHGIDFVSPCKLMSIAPRAVLLPESGFVKPRNDVQTYFSPWAQLVVLRHLLRDGEERRIPYSHIVKELNLRHSYLTRAAGELESRGIARTTYSGRSAFLEFVGDRRQVWRLSQEFLHSPVRKTIRIKMPPHGVLLAGISALARISDLADDNERVYAISPVAARNVEPGDVCSTGGCKLEIWRYDPRLLSADSEYVDGLSLALSLRKEASIDPRVEIEVGKLEEKILC